MLEALCRTTSSVTYVRIASSSLVERGKDKTVRNSTSLKRSISTVIANVPNCIQPASSLWYDNARPKGNLGSARKIVV